MPDFTIKLNGKVDRRSPRDEGEADSPTLRENWLPRDGKLSKPPGHTAQVTDLSDIPRWMGRYHTIETGATSPKTFVYTQDGTIHLLDDQLNTSSIVKQLLNQNASPRHWLFKTNKQTKMFLVDGITLFQYDGNNDNKFETVALLDADGNSVEPIDVIEHRDRLFVISKTNLFVSKNLEPEVFDDANDSIEIIVGSGKGTNLALGKIEDKLYIFNTEGIFILDGDVISALAATFEVRLVDERRIVAGGTATKVEKAILFLADDYEIWSWDGSNAQMLTFELILKDFVFKDTAVLSKANAIYHDNYYKMSFVQGGEGTEPNIEVWWDAFENKPDIVKGRHVSCYMKTDATIETEYLQMGQSNANTIVEEGIGNNFDGTAISTRIRSRDLTPKLGFNVRFIAFFPKFMPTGNRNIEIHYLLDGRLSNPTPNDAVWTQNLRGEILSPIGLPIVNQGQFTDRIRPSIDYARGESIGFEIIEATDGLKADFVAMRVEYIVKHASKGVTIGA